MRKHLYRDALFATVFVFALYLLLKLVFLNLHFLDPGNQEKEDFEITDIVYSKFRQDPNDPVRVSTFDTNIVLVNSGRLTRNELADVLERIGEQNPKVIGIDIFFDENRKQDDSALAAAISKYSNKIVLGAVLGYDVQGNVSTMEKSQPLYSSRASNGYTNFTTRSILSVVRRYAPMIKTTQGEYSCFPLMVAEKFNPDVRKEAVQRNNRTEIINYRYLQQDFITFDHNEIVNDNPNLARMKDKIVLLGFIAADVDVPVIEDYHYTPMNDGEQNKTEPDMCGMAIHANIVSMMLDNRYISHVPKWLLWIISFILCYVHMIWFSRYFMEQHMWFHLYFKIIQLISAAVIVGVSVLLYGKFDLRVETGILLAPIILSVDALYFFEPLMIWLHKKKGIATYFYKEHH